MIDRKDQNYQSTVQDDLWPPDHPAAFYPAIGDAGSMGADGAAALPKTRL